MNWNIRIIGEGRKTPLLWLHGFMGSGEDWLEMIMNHFPDQTHILIDLPGHGDYKINSQLQFKAAIDDLTDRLKKLQINSFIPVGYSMGGRLAFHLQRTAPNMIPALIVLSGAPGLKSDFERKHRREADEQLMDSLEQVGFARFLVAWYSAPLFGSIRTNTALFDRLKKKRSSNNTSQLRLSLRLIGNGALPPLWENLGNINIPTLLITGGADTKYMQLNQEMRELIPACAHKLVPAAGHAFHLEKPLETAGIIRHFLSTTIEGE